MDEVRTHDTLDIDLGFAFRKLLKRWKLLFAVSILGAGAVYGISKLLPKQYESKATLYVQQNSVASSLMNSLPAGILTKQGSTSGYFVSLLCSDTMLRDVINRLSLMENPKFNSGDKMTNAKALELMKNSVRVVENKNGAIDIRVTLSDPHLAASIANSMLDNLENMVMTSSKRKADFISSKLSESSQKLRRAEDEMLKFQQANDLAALDEETKGMIDQLVDLDKQLLGMDVEIKQVDSQLNNSGELNSLVDMEVKKKSLESGRNLLANKVQTLQSKLSSLPAVASRYARLQRNLAVLSKTYELLTEQYQLANISQHGEDGDYQIIDRAAPSVKPVKPKAALNGAAAGVFCFFITALVILNSGSKRPENQAIPKKIAA